MRDRIIVLGCRGFIGKRILENLNSCGRIESKNLYGFSSSDVDLTNRSQCQILEGLLGNETTVVFCSGLKKQVGDSLKNFSANVAMVENYLQLGGVTETRTIFISTADVYGDDLNRVRISEASPVRLSSYYAIAKFTSECLLNKALGNLVVLRPPLVYGLGEVDPVYGPGGFFRSARGREEVALWGDGQERREFLWLDDLVALVRRCVLSDVTGISNVTFGRRQCFRDAINEIEKVIETKVVVRSRERTRSKIDLEFQPGAFLTWFPDFRETTLSEGVRSLNQEAESE